MRFPQPDGTDDERKKYVVVLHTSGNGIYQVPVLICSTDRKPEVCRPFEVQIPLGTLDWLPSPTKIDCRWVFTLGKRALGAPFGSLPDELMADADAALFVGLEMG